MVSLHVNRALRLMPTFFFPSQFVPLPPRNEPFSVYNLNNRRSRHLLKFDRSF